MPELIDRYATMDAIPAPTDADEAEYYDKICDAIETMPTIEAEPVRNGRWIEHGGGLVATCSNCNATYRKDVLQSLSPYAEQLTRHCPNCGARMDAIETNTGCKGVDDNDT